MWMVERILFSVFHPAERLKKRSKSTWIGLSTRTASRAISVRNLREFLQAEKEEQEMAEACMIHDLVRHRS
jgi:hypothetical protein